MARVQNAALGSASSASVTDSAAFASNPTVGNYVAVMCWGWNSSHTTGTPTITDNIGGNTYTIPTNGFQAVNNDVWCLVAYAKVAATGAGLKARCTTPGGWAANGSIMVCAAEYSGVAASSPENGSVGTAPGTTAQTFAPGNLTVNSTDLVVAVHASDSAGNPTNLTSPGAPLVSEGRQLNGSTFEAGEGMTATGVTTPSNPTWTTTAAASKWAAAQFALLAASGAASPVLQDLMHRPGFMPLLCM
jgi:hypothetical protein